MTDPTQTPDPAAVAGGDPPAAPARPDWLPESHWDATAGIKPEFGAHYTEIANFHKSQTEAQTALAARKPEDIKIEVKLPDTIQVPDGMEFKIDDSDPRVPALRAMALKHSWSQEQVNDLVAFDAQQQIAAHTSEQTRLAGERQKLGANADARIEAAAAWAKSLQNVSSDELEEVKILTATSAGISLLEKLMLRSSGNVPGAGGITTPAQDPVLKSLAERMYPNLPTTKAS